MTKVKYVSEEEYKEIEDRIANHAIEIRDKLIDQQNKAIQELASALDDCVRIERPCYEVLQSYDILANKHLKE